MQFRKAVSFALVSRRSRGRKGLEAIFSSQEAGREREVLTGAVGILAGLFLSIVAIFRTDAPQALGLLANAVYSSLAFGALGVLLLICGGGTITFALARESKLLNRTGSPVDRVSEVDAIGDAVSHSGSRRMFGPGSKMGAVAFIESLVLVALYSGFVQEFESNVTMQIWVRSNFPVGQYLLNWEGVLVLSVCLGLLLLQFLPGRFFSEQ